MTQTKHTPGPIEIALMGDLEYQMLTCPNNFVISDDQLAEIERRAAIAKAEGRP